MNKNPIHRNPESGYWDRLKLAASFVLNLVLGASLGLFLASALAANLTVSLVCLAPNILYFTVSLVLYVVTGRRITKGTLYGDWQPWEPNR
jgi:hypothetical protein